MNIIKYIPVGQANAISTKELIETTGLSQRHVCAAIERARTAGEVILSKADGGYWLPDMDDMGKTRAELQSFVRFMNSRNTFKTTSSARAMIRELTPSDTPARTNRHNAGNV